MARTQSSCILMSSAWSNSTPLFTFSFFNTLKISQKNRKTHSNFLACFNIKTRKPFYYFSHFFHISLLLLCSWCATAITVALFIVQVALPSGSPCGAASNQDAHDVIFHTLCIVAFEIRHQEALALGRPPCFP